MVSIHSEGFQSSNLYHIAPIILFFESEDRLFYPDKCKVLECGIVFLLKANFSTCSSSVLVMIKICVCFIRELMDLD